MKIIEFLNSENIQSASTILIAIFAFLFSIYQFIKGYKINSGVFLIQLRELFLEEKKYQLHLELRNKPSYTPKDWSIVDDYLGTFEVVNIMIKRGALDKRNIKDLYGYRIANIIKNQNIFEKKLVLEFKSWKNFYDLINLLDGTQWKAFYKLLLQIELRSEKSIVDFDSVEELLRSLDAKTKKKYDIAYDKLNRINLGTRLT